MNKRIVWTVILVPLLVIGLVLIIGCGEPKPKITTPEQKMTAPEQKMTAPEVCQYVNQALTDEYRYESATRRYLVRFTARKARYSDGMGTWCVSVEVTSELQQFENGQWIILGGSPPFLNPYFFNEETGAVTYAPDMFEP